MIFNETEEQEKAYLQQVLNIINDTINSTDKSVKEHIDTLQEYKDYLWSNKDIDPHEIRSMRESILNHFARGENVIDKRNRLSKILDIPYFGRIDFKENGSSGKKLPVYIGIHTFYDFKNKRNLIYDWRSPISGMFYDYESGEATYSSPSGEVHGEISLPPSNGNRTGLSATKIRPYSSYRESPAREKRLLPYTVLLTCSMHKKEKFHPKIF